METIWVVTSTALLVFCLLMIYKAYKMGYKRGASDVLTEWKYYMKELEENE